MVNWDPVFNCVNVNEAADLFQKMLMDIVDIHAPIIRLKLRYHAPGWFNHDFLSHVNEHEFWSRKYKKCLFNYHLKF